MTRYFISAFLLLGFLWFIRRVTYTPTPGLEDSNPYEMSPAWRTQRTLSDLRAVALPKGPTKAAR